MKKSDALAFAGTSELCVSEVGDFLRLALPFDIVLHAHHLTIEYGIGELPYPVAENHKSA